MIPRPQESVRIRTAVLQKIVAHAREQAPDECCGLLVGAAADEGPAGEAGEIGEIDEAVPATNIERGPTRYQIDPREHLALQKRLRGTGRGITGAYHSHPQSPAVPSPSDLSEAFYPEFVYLILSLADADHPEIRAWRIVDGAASEIALIAVS